MAERDY